MHLLSRCVIADCWTWTGATTHGYGQIGRKTYGEGVLHRYVWKHLVGPIPDEMTLDHLCRNLLCCNPDHLRILTRGANVLAGYGPTVIAHRTDTCLNGHPLEGNNVYDDQHSGRRRCRTCLNAKNRRAYERNAETRREYARAYRIANADRLIKFRKQKWANRNA
jgi:HNH endonuclease